MVDAYRVFVVLDREYGERLSALTQRGPVWIVDTPVNRAAADNMRALHRYRSHLDGITTFATGNGLSPEDLFINELDTIDLHHGIYSADPPYTELEVIGTAISDKVKAELSQFSFNAFQPTTEGFLAIRPLPSDGMAR